MVFDVIRQVTLLFLWRNKLNSKDGKVKYKTARVHYMNWKNSLT